MEIEGMFEINDKGIMNVNTKSYERGLTLF